MSEITCDVAILMGSKSDLPTMKPAADVLQALGLRVAVRLVKPQTIQRSEGKAKRVIDRRNLV